MDSMSSDSSSIVEINVTSLVDVSLVLVIIFMIISPFAMQIGITVSASKMGESKGKVAQEENVMVNLNEKGEIRVNGRVVTWEKLPDVLKTGIKKSKDNMVMILASPKNQVKQVVDILDCARQQGAKKLAVMKIKEK